MLWQVVNLENQWMQRCGVAGWSSMHAVTVAQALTRWRLTYLLLPLEEYGEELSAGIVRLCTDESSTTQLLGACSAHTFALFARMNSVAVVGCRADGE